MTHRLCDWDDVAAALESVVIDEHNARLRLEREYQIIKLNALYAARVEEQKIRHATDQLLNEIEFALAEVGSGENRD